MKVFMQKDEMFYICLINNRENVFGAYQNTRFLRESGALISIEYEFLLADGKIRRIPRNDIKMILPLVNKWIDKDDIMNGTASK